MRSGYAFIFIQKASIDLKKCNVNGTGCFQYLSIEPFKTSRFRLGDDFFSFSPCVDWPPIGSTGKFALIGDAIGEKGVVVGDR